jgi:hypothetical protein
MVADDREQPLFFIALCFPSGGETRAGGRQPPHGEPKENKQAHTPPHPTKPKPKKKTRPAKLLVRTSPDEVFFFGPPDPGRGGRERGRAKKKLKHLPPTLCGEYMDA